MTDVMPRAAESLLVVACMPSSSATPARSADGAVHAAGSAGEERFEEMLAVRLGAGGRDEDGSRELDRETARATDRNGEGAGSPALGSALGVAPMLPGFLGPTGLEQRGAANDTFEPIRARKMEHLAAARMAPTVDEHTTLRGPPASSELGIENVRLSTWRHPVRATPSVLADCDALARGVPGHYGLQTRVPPTLENRIAVSPPSDRASTVFVLATDAVPPAQSKSGQSTSGQSTDRRNEQESRGGVAGALGALSSNGRVPSVAAAMKSAAIDSSRSPGEVDVGSQVVAALGGAIGAIRLQVAAGDGAEGASRPADVRQGAQPGTPAPLLVRQLSIELDPADLGRIEVQLTMVDGALDIDLRAEVGATARYIVEQSKEIAERLEESGYLVERVRVSHGALDATRIDASPAAPNEQFSAYRDQLDQDQRGGRWGGSSPEEQGQRRERDRGSHSDINPAKDAAEVASRSAPLRHRSV